MPTVSPVSFRDRGGFSVTMTDKPPRSPWLLRRMTGQFPRAGPATPRQRALHAKGDTGFRTRRTFPPLRNTPEIITGAAASSGRAMDRRGALAISQQGPLWSTKTKELVPCGHDGAGPGPGGGIFRRRRRPPRAIRPAVLRAGSAATWFGLGEVAVECEAPQRGSSRGSDARGGFRARPGSQCALVERALHRRSMIAFAGCLDRRP